MWDHANTCENTSISVLCKPWIHHVTSQYNTLFETKVCSARFRPKRAEGQKRQPTLGDSRLGHFRRRFVGQRLLMATCGLGGPMNPKSKTCFRYFPTNATEDIIYIYSKKQAAPKRGYPFKSCVFIQISMAHCRKAGPCKSPCKLFSLLAPLQNPIEKTVLLICFVAIPNGAASYRRLNPCLGSLLLKNMRSFAHPRGTAS